MRTRQTAADAELRPQSAKALATDDTPMVMMTRAQLRELVQDALVLALSEYEAGKQPAAELVSSAEMAQKLGVSRAKLNKMRAAGEIPAVRLGDSVRFSPTEVIARLRGGE